MTYPYPPDDPAEVATVVATLRSAAGPQADAVDGLRRHALRQHPPWRSYGGDAAVAEVDRLAALCADGATGLQSAALALTRYRDALLRARAGVDRLNERYGAAFVARQRAAQAPHAHGADEWSTELAGIERGHHAVLADLDAVSRQTARTLRHALRPIGGRSDDAAIIPALARRLPMWEQRAATETAESAARAVLRQPRTTQQRAKLIQRYAAWQDDPVFAKQLLERLGPAMFRSLLANGVPIKTPKDSRTLDEYYGFFGHVLGAAPVGKQWLAGLTDKLTARINYFQFVGLGLALRYGTYRATTLDALVPVLYSTPWTPISYGDPLVGVMHALASNPPAAGRFLQREPDCLQMLLSRVWRDDDGRALGAFLVATSTLHDAIGAAAAEFTVHWVAHHMDLVPTGLYAGLGEMLGGYIDDVNHGIIDLSSGAPMVENALPVVSPPPHAHFTQADLMRTIYLVMQSGRGSLALYSHQAIYAADQLERQVHSRGPSTVLSELAVNYGRLSKIHELAVVKQAKLANASEADRLRNKTTWITLASVAAGLLPIPGVRGIAATAAGITKGQGVNSVASSLQKRFYDTPLARDSAKRFTHADQLAIAEEQATRKYIATLTKRLGGDSSNRWISSQSIGAGRDNAESVLKGVK